MKRIISLLLVFIMGIGILAGCGNSEEQKDESKEEQKNEIIKSENGNFFNSKYDMEKMVTLDGTEFNIKDNNNVFGKKDLGFGITYTKYMATLRDSDSLNATVNVPYFMSLSYIPSSLINEAKETDFESMSKEEQDAFWGKINDKTFKFIGIFRKPENDENGETEFENFSNSYKNIEELGKLGDDTYYMGSNTDYSILDNLTNKEKEELDTIISEIDTFKKGIFIFPYSAVGEVSFEGNMTAFNADTLSGKKATQDILKDYDVTMVNVWATFCSPCIEEMPELQKVYKNLPDNSNMITICIDGETEKEMAEEIYDSVKGSFDVLFPDDRLKESLLNNINAVPTTIFVDKNGMPVSEPIIGVPDRENAAEKYLEHIKDCLNQIDQ
ncbi:TlpA family protein disulfide reductase [Anaerovorax odorimutans]|uniref:TlpA family protein disulfide reductase n=1 Tax=Anaerovorax odorimutans TaxID=109327 RepID=UPI000401189B|nr:TlpA disulfide reductase family protein [Anaerovorax odorimutans]